MQEAALGAIGVILPGVFELKTAKFSGSNNGEGFAKSTDDGDYRVFF